VVQSRFATVFKANKKFETETFVKITKMVFEGCILMSLPYILYRSGQRRLLGNFGGASRKVCQSDNSLHNLYYWHLRKAFLIFNAGYDVGYQIIRMQRRVRYVL
jgi:hypothetical protein